MSAFGGKADIGSASQNPLMTQSGHPALVQGLGTLGVLLRPLRSIGAACVRDGLRASDAPLLCKLACAGERFAGTGEDVLMLPLAYFLNPSSIKIFGQRN
jgi:hypothetical protein